jgi:Pyruvate kinase, barrel domain
MPGLSVDLPAMSAKDMQDIKWGIKNDVIILQPQRCNIQEPSTCTSLITYPHILTIS